LNNYKDLISSGYFFSYNLPKLNPETNEHKQIQFIEQNAKCAIIGYIH